MSDEERAQVMGLIRWLYAQTGLATWAQFARLARVSELSLSEWRAGRGAPDSANLLRLLLAADAIKPDARRAYEKAATAEGHCADRRC